MNQGRDKPVSLDQLKIKLEQATTPSLLEELGKEISIQQLLLALGELNELGTRKLSTILVGLPHNVFLELLRNTKDADLNYFKKTAQIEPLQHHLAMIGHDIQEQIKAKENILDHLWENINELKPEECGNEDSNTIEVEAEKHTRDLQELSSIIDKALAISWNTSRKDLIESFSHSKERAKTLLSRSIGTPRQKNNPPTGLYAHLENHLFSTFTDGDFFEKLNDNDDVLEVLAKFSIRTLADYQEVGLISKETNIEKSDASQACEFLSIPPHLFQQASNRLTALGLNTLSDMKRARIFSKQRLKEYILSRN